MAVRQPELFSNQPGLPAGFRYEEDFLSPAAEAALLSDLERLAFANARYKEWTAKRRIVSYGGRYDFSTSELLPASPVPPFLVDLRAAAAGFAGATAAELTHALVAEYPAATQLGWHRDVPEFELVVGISLKGAARMRLRRYPHVAGSRERSLAVELAPRSIYCLQGEARWGWQHAISPTPGLRYSITFRSLRRADAR
ncbi:MAG TPA: alpha-ketoglutarate-dependent dioxygenase AlkB [Gammaproteobacteria bacterium]|nr:alpha-ketoglutarate-dependent dioxygenase AlkB [Gammaproteobacteria bacterium]